jgi:RHS repeat-associated protein
VLKSGASFAWLLPDLHGNVAAGIDSGETTVSDAWRYDGYGRTAASTSSSGLANPWTYQGRLDLAPAGEDPFYAAGARAYDPNLGTFTQLDSLAGSAQDPLSLNRYLYAEANPSTLIDPDGHMAVRVSGGRVHLDQQRAYYTSHAPAAARRLRSQQISRVMSRLASTNGEPPSKSMRTVTKAPSTRSVQIDAAKCFPPINCIVNWDYVSTSPNADAAIARWICAGVCWQPTGIDAGVVPLLPGGRGLSSFRQAKSELGPAGTNRVYDHVVEQSQMRRSGFPPEMIHNSANLEPVAPEINQLKANYYSSIRGFTGRGTVRDWLTGQEFDKQLEFGLDVLRRLLGGDPLP